MSGPAVRDEAAAMQHGRAGLVSRLLAAVCDLTIVVVGILALLLLGAVLRYVLLGPPFTVHSLGMALEAPAASLLAVAYLAYFWSATGRTPGDQLLGLRVLDPSGRRLGGGRAVLRAALCVAFPIGLLWTAVSRRNASVQDLVVRTEVIHDWRIEALSAPDVR